MITRRNFFGLAAVAALAPLALARKKPTNPVPHFGTAGTRLKADEFIAMMDYRIALAEKAWVRSIEDAFYSFGDPL